MARSVQEYRNDTISVTFEPRLCIHSALCLRGLPAVFDVGRRAWVDVDAATAEEIATVVATCPSGALQFERLDGGAAEQAQEPVTIEARTNGPLRVRGRVQVLDGSGALLRETTRATLCRCGHSSNKPFCDNSHREAGFQAP